jgi:hypothetical protein
LEGSENYFSHFVIPAKTERWTHIEVWQLFDEDLSPGVEVKEWDRTIHASENRLICCHGRIGPRMPDSNLTATFVGIHDYVAEGPKLEVPQRVESTPSVCCSNPETLAFLIRICKGK